MSARRHGQLGNAAGGADHGREVFDLAIDGVRRRVTAVAASTPVVGIHSEWGASNSASGAKAVRVVSAGATRTSAGPPPIRGSGDAYARK